MTRDTMIARLVDAGLPAHLAHAMSEYELGDSLAVITNDTESETP